ncbi:fungal cellulose binding domain-containing protein [Plectosphaerella plurivora]|uniref:Fungal cellulose binding domain-containing protein n=1 Tax=Plectosphaerella plurivora TaxID=936078 RepID=A0A9P8V1E8_9PEZI|nr:fungal cellulose binding domain-containing protein [Plectosphaerella plurivora]
MLFLSRDGAVRAVIHSLLFGTVFAQFNPTPWTSPSGVRYQQFFQPRMRWGYIFPANAATVDATEFIGFLECATPNGPEQGWCGISMTGSMRQSLLLMAYPHDGEVLTQFYGAVNQESAFIYTGGNPTITQISSSVNATHFTIEFRCQNCMSWTIDSIAGSVSTSAGFWVPGIAHSIVPPTGNLDCPASIVVTQHNSQTIFGGPTSAGWFDADYARFAALATDVVPGTCGGPGPSTTTGVPTSTVSSVPTSVSSNVPPPSGVPVPNETYDYVVVGAGAGGIPIADKLSEAGHKVLLIEKGPPSTGRHGGTRGPAWLAGTGLTRFDVPGLCNEIWHDSAGIACRDTDQMAGCILGGGTAINAALWWKPYALDWDFNFPTGWKSTDVAAATNRVFSRIPGTTRPSSDGQIYLPNGMNVIRDGLRSAGWRDTDLNANPNLKNRTFGNTPYMYANGERGGPLATYLVTAKARSNFKLWTNTAVRRLVRTGGHVTGIEVEPYFDGGYQGTVRLTPVTGRVILSSGTFGSAKILLRSGIGPQDQLYIVGNSTLDKGTMISQDQWINLPVGYNLEDHTNTDVVVRHPSVQFYDFYLAYDGLAPYQSDIQAYVSNRRGILAQSAPNIGPLFFDEIKGSDGRVRQLQYTARMEGSLGEEDPDLITISQYLGRGATSRGRMTITPGLITEVSTVPYLRNSLDEEAVIRGLETLKRSLANVPNLQWVHPAPNETPTDYVKNYFISTGGRRANHWIGTAKLGNNDGRISGGDSVVDTNTKVYGTDNVFVVDASIFPGHVTTNPSSYIVVASEHAASKILALAPARAAAVWEQCGGREWRGTFQCAAGLTCRQLNPYYYQVSFDFLSHERCKLTLSSASSKVMRKWGRGEVLGTHTHHSRLTLCLYIVFVSCRGFFKFTY